MTEREIIVSETLTIKRCPVCSVRYALPKDLIDRRREDHDKGEKVNWWCPNGHSLVFSAEPEIEAIRRERDLAQQQLARADEERGVQHRRALKAEKEIKRQAKRAAAGVCPCCHRTFQQLVRHMAVKHPDTVKNTGLKVLTFNKEEKP